MKNMPPVFKFILNVLIYIVYWGVVSLVVGVGISLLAGGVNPFLADKIGLFLAILVLLVTLISRKYCYISLGEQSETKVVKESYTQQKKTQAKKKQINSKKTTKKGENTQTAQEDDDIKIYIEKEIK